MKKGFTLVELLAVITILGILALIMFPIVLKQINDAKGEINDATNMLIIDAAKDYIEDNINNYRKMAGATYCIDLKTLIDANYLNGNLKDTNLNNINETKKIKMMYSNGFSYEVTDECIPS